MQHEVVSFFYNKLQTTEYLLNTKTIYA